MDALLDPVVFFFILGIFAGIVKSDLKVPATIYEILSIYLLLAIGLKGGVALSKADLSSLIFPFLGTFSVGIIIPLIAFFFTYQLLRYPKSEAAALATHYGSVSAVTFAVCLSYLSRQEIPYDQFSTVMLVILEVPALIIGISIAKIGTKDFKSQIGKIMHEVIFGKSILLLLGGLLIGFICGPEKMTPLNSVFVDLFKGMLAFFLLEMGLVVSNRLEALKKAGVSLVIFGILMPLISATIGSFIAVISGLSLGGVVVLATLAASASYIAAPAAVRVGIPEANPAIYLTASLAITFPFNVIIGIPVYHWMAVTFKTILGG